MLQAWVSKWPTWSICLSNYWQLYFHLILSSAFSKYQLSLPKILFLFVLFLTCEFHSAFQLIVLKNHFTFKDWRFHLFDFQFYLNKEHIPLLIVLITRLLSPFQWHVLSILWFFLQAQYLLILVTPQNLLNCLIGKQAQ